MIYRFIFLNFRCLFGDFSMFLIVRLLSVLKLNLIRSLIDEFRSDGKKGLKILNM